MSYSRRKRASARLFAPLIWLACAACARGGPDPVRITTDGKLKLSPVVLADGKEVVFAIHDRPNAVALVRLDLSDGTRQPEYSGSTAHQFDPAYSRDGRWAVYARSSTAPQLVLVIHDRAEKKDTLFRPRDSRATARNPAFAPDGSVIVFSLSDHGGQQIASVDHQGNSLKILTNSAGMNAWPAFSPDGRSIVFGSSRNGDFEIYVMDAGGGNVRRLTRSPGLDIRPAWSPDGKSIAFTSNRDGNYEIYIMDADGSHPRNLTTHAGRDDHAAWHPDGARLLYVSDRAGGSDLYMITVR